MPVNRIRFSVAAHAAWAPGEETALAAMPAMLRRRASMAGKMALQAAYAAYPAPAAESAAFPESGRQDIPVIFCSRHGECGRSADLLIDLARGLPLSPTAFSLSVHNATGGLFSIARRDHANSLALAAGSSTVEHAAIEACSLLADGAPAVLLAMADGPLPPMYREFADCDEQPFGWAWLLTAAPDAAVPDTDTISLCWSAAENDCATDGKAQSGGLQVMRFFLNGEDTLQRHADRRLWTWRRERPQ
ncbi:3-oxoacyl-ACP synthase [Oxalobacteraceae bacterium CAVE-383]|nr:3-oxoacyl-ACP synthase [Oxalobacteraceae bacterium CAVE-383]